MTPSPHWIEDCTKWRGLVLTGEFSHWCADWDDLPMDETCPEWPCGCAPFFETCKHWELSDDQLVNAAIDNLWLIWYSLGMPFHIRFVCKTCKRSIAGCPKSCQEPHRTEEIESCAVCKSQKKEKQEGRSANETY